MGDFNKIACPNEKIGGSTLNINRFQCLNNFVTVPNVETLQVTKNILTWKKRAHTLLMFKRLGNRYRNAYELHGNFTCLDHRTIIMSTQIQQTRTKAFSFCFQNF